MSEWISVYDALPTDHREVLVYGTGINMSFCDIAERISGNEKQGAHWSGNAGWYSAAQITHWMPLPKPPSM